MLAVLEVVRNLDLPCALIACGGIHTLEQARQALLAGADAIQIDSAIWVEPSLPARLAIALAVVIGDWGWGSGRSTQSPIPDPHSPNPSKQRHLLRRLLPVEQDEWHRLFLIAQAELAQMGEIGQLALMAGADNAIGQNGTDAGHA